MYGSNSFHPFSYHTSIQRISSKPIITFYTYTHRIHLLISQ